MRSSLATALATTLGLCGCDLRVSNPGAIDPAALQDVRYINLMVNGVIGEFQPMFSTYYQALFTDELYNHHVYFEEREIDLRRIPETSGTYNVFLFTPMHRARFLADSIASRLRNLLGDSAARDLRLARVLAYGGYTYTLMGKALCETPINLSRPYRSDELLQMAIDRFQQAIAVAEAAKAATTVAAVRNGADSVANLARVGAARAALNLGNRTLVLQFAAAVPANFEFRVWHSENSSREYNPFSNRFAEGASNVSASVSNTPFQGLNDPRVPHPPQTERTMNGALAFVPNSPSAFSTYTGTLPGGEFTRSASVRLASGLEARYIRAEAEGLSADNVAFVNQRRAIGGQAPLTNPTPEQYLAALREQRARDFFLNGQRLGDLRRYKRLYNLNLFPTGPYPGGVAGETYGDQECWPITLAERQGNPYYRP